MKFNEIYNNDEYYVYVGDIEPLLSNFRYFVGFCDAEILREHLYGTGEKPRNTACSRI